VSKSEADWDADASNDSGYIETYTGRLFYPLNPDPDDVDLQDIAHALSMKCRYTGHTRNFYSVAEHSVLMAEWFEEQDCPWRALYALLHDATEAYLPDVPRPVKLKWGWWPEIESKVNKAIMSHFRCPHLTRDRAVVADVKRADTRILLTEAVALMRSRSESFGDWKKDYTPLPVATFCWTPVRARDAFLRAYDRLKSDGMP